MVSARVGVILTVNHRAGTGTIGLLAIYSIAITRAMLVLHRRVGGPASAAVIANGLWGTLGIIAAPFAAASAVRPFGTATVLALLLAVPPTWNLPVWIVRQRRARVALRPA